jgi:hypothetical protein
MPLTAKQEMAEEFPKEMAPIPCEAHRDPSALPAGMLQLED